MYIQQTYRKMVDLSPALPVSHVDDLNTAVNKQKAEKLDSLSELQLYNYVSFVRHTLNKKIQAS